MQLYSNKRPYKHWLEPATTQWLKLPQLDGKQNCTETCTAASESCYSVISLSYLITYLLTTFSTALLEKGHILWNPKVHYRIHKYPPLVPILSQLNPVHTPTTTFWTSILILSSHLRLGLPSGLLPPGLTHRNPVYTSPLPHTRYMPRPSHSSRFYHRTMFGEQYKSLSSSLCSFLHSPVTSSLLDPNTSLNTLFFKHPQPTFLPQFERPSFTPINNNRQNYSSVYLNR